MTAALTAAKPIQDLLKSRPNGVFLDIDGTISRIAATPAEATVSDRARLSLAALQSRVDRLTFVSGRSPGNAQDMVGIVSPRVAYVGNHGMSWLLDGHDTTPDEAMPYCERVRDAVTEIASLLEFPGILFEPRGPLLTIHYRQVQDPEVARDLILRTVAYSEAARGMELSEGRKIIELRPPLPINKGTAIEALARKWELRAAVMVGDDLTDVHAFDGLVRLREQDGVDTISVAVLSVEADPAVAAAADYTLAGVDEVEDLLDELAAIRPAT